MSELDEIMSGDGLAAPEIQQEATQQQPRDESGRFASSQPQQVEQPAAVAEMTDAGEGQQHEDGRGIPPQRLKAEADRRREAEANAEALRREIAELRGMVQANRQPVPQQQVLDRQPIEIFDDPNAFIEEKLSPFQQQMQEIREELWESRAVGMHGAEKVTAAKAAAEALASPAEKLALHRQLMVGGNPFDNLVKWHQQQQVMGRIGNDPDAWLNAEIEKRMADPTFQAQVMERARTGAAANTSRAQPVTSFPPSLSRMPAGGNQPADSDMSDAGLFAHATQR